MTPLHHVSLFAAETSAELQFFKAAWAFASIAALFLGLGILAGWIWAHRLRRQLTAELKALDELHLRYRIVRQDPRLPPTREG